ncbi:CLC_0170 family protein [Alicyclobacillus dauci]|uniref:CLC_0170 family protein n=1 Tax=Alicyclobacillus dauci TaxID=1475485 RepID=UPI003898D5E9
MISLDLTQPYPVLCVLLFFGCGLLVFIADVRTYRKRGMVQEERFSVAVAWTNVVCGAGLLLALWIYNQFVW